MGSAEQSHQEGEFALIDEYFGAAHSTPPAPVTLGIGDDAAIISPPTEASLIAVCRTLASGIDFERNANPEELGPRLIRHCLATLRNRSVDTAYFAMLAITMRANDVDWLDAFASGLNAELDTFGIPLVGGDTTQGPLTATLTVYGWTD